MAHLPETTEPAPQNGPSVRPAVTPQTEVVPTQNQRPCANSGALNLVLTYLMLGEQFAVTGRNSAVIEVPAAATYICLRKQFALIC